MRDLDIIPHAHTFRNYIASLGVRGNVSKVIELCDEYHLVGYPFEPELARSAMYSFLQLKNYEQVKATYQYHR